MKKITTQFYILLIIVMSLNLKLVIASEYDEGEIKLDDGSIEMINSAISNYENYLNNVIQDTMTVEEQKNAINGLLQNAEYDIYGEINEYNEIVTVDDEEFEKVTLQFPEVELFYLDDYNLGVIAITDISSLTTTASRTFGDAGLSSADVYYSVSVGLTGYYYYYTDNYGSRYGCLYHANGNYSILDSSFCVTGQDVMCAQQGSTTNYHYYYPGASSSWETNTGFTNYLLCNDFTYFKVENTIYVNRGSSNTYFTARTYTQW